MNENLVSANEFRAKLDMDPVKSAKHKLAIWPNEAGVRSKYVTFKCVKCTRGRLTMEGWALRQLVSGEWPNLMLMQAFGSWPVCREDLDEPLRPPTTLS